MGRRILFITTDQQRYDALGCNGGRVARTPAIDALAAQGVRFERAHANSVVCMPARSTMLTGQYVRTHGVRMNGIPLPAEAPSVAQLLQRAGYRTALFGKAHFEPVLDPARRFPENALGPGRSTGPYRGFERVEFALHSAIGPSHYALWMNAEHPAEVRGFYPPLDASFNVNDAGGGDTGACQVKHNPVPREHYHTDWVAARTIAWLRSLPEDADWFCWLSFPDPHHPWDPPQSELGRCDWRSLDPPAAYPGTAARCRAILARKPRHWLDWFDGRLVSNYEAPPKFVPAAMTLEQIREVNAMVHIENELIDEAVGRVLRALRERGWDADTDIFYTADHGELQGDFGLLFKGPYHVDALMRLPLIWRPAPSAAIPAAAVTRPVSQVDLAPTFLAVAGAPIPPAMQGRPLPVSEAEAERQGRSWTFTEWDSDIHDVILRLRTLYEEGWVCTAYEPGSVHDGSEGELYDLRNDPLQHHNLWDDSGRASLRRELLQRLREITPAEGPHLMRLAPV